MKAYEITMFRDRLSNDPENLNIRRTFHEHYEWLDAYWAENYGSNSISKFCKDHETFYWDIISIREIARKFCFYTPVASSSYNFEPTKPIKSATYYLKHKGNLVQGGPNDDYEEQIAEGWKKSPFEALLTILKQIRDNLFHGKKMELEAEQYQRNKDLISMAVTATAIILDNLEKAEATKYHSK